MTLPELSIRRHVFTWMASAVIVLWGVISYWRIGIDKMPAIDFPMLMITTTLKGASPEIVDTSITSVIESAINTTPGIEHIQSSSSPGVSSINIIFNLDKDIRVAYNEVQSKINEVLKRLPTNTDPPILQKVDTNAQAVIWFALTGDRTIQQLNLYAINVLKKRLETIDGVGEVVLGGRRDRVIQVRLLPEKMSAYKLNIQDITRAFDREHIQFPGGFLVSHNTEKLLNLDMEFHSISEIENLIVRYKNGAPILLKYVAIVEDGITDPRQIARYNGKPAVGLGLIKVANANTLKIIDTAIQRVQEEIIPTLAPGLKLEISTNDGIFIRQTIFALKEHIFLGTLLSALLVWLFLRSFRATIIIALAIPVSLLASMAVMYFSDYTFNSMTLLALLLLIGVVVDDAIVVLENIVRHRQKHSLTRTNDSDTSISPEIKGANEVSFAVIAASLSLVCIFAPVVFMSGILGMFFRSFGVVVTCGVLASLFVSLTLTPMLCARYLTKNTTPRLETQKKWKSLFRFNHESAPISNQFDNSTHFFESWKNSYQKALKYSLQYPKLTLLIALLFVVFVGGFCFKNVKKDFVPESDEAAFSISIKTPLGSTLAYTDDRTKQIEAILKKYRSEGIESYFMTIGLGSRGQVNQGSISVRLTPKEKRKVSQKELMKQLKREFEQVAGLKAIPSPSSIVRGQRSEKLQFTVIDMDLEKLANSAKKMQKALSEIDGIGRVDLDLQLDLPQLRMAVDRTRSADVGLSPAEIATAVGTYTGGVNIAKYNDVIGGGQRYDIRLRGLDRRIETTQDLKQIYISNKDGNLVRLDGVADLIPELGPAVISRFDLRYSANFFANPTTSLGEAISLVERTAKKVLSADQTFRMTGQAEEFGKTMKNVKFVFIIAFLLLYMVLASQFNSFAQPFIIMLAQPLAIVGGLIALWMTGMSLNIYSMIGLVLLIGLVAKNSILLIDLTNQLHRQGLSRYQALLTACPIRMRPVVMTSLTIIGALLPAAFGLSAGSETNQPLAVAIIGGVISSTLLTLIVVPSAYLITKISAK